MTPSRFFKFVIDKLRQPSGGVTIDSSWMNPLTVPGPQGIQGLKGDTGIQGNTGTTGIQGIQGVQGLLGPIAGSMINPVGLSVVEWTIPAGVRRLTLLSSRMAVPSDVIVRFGTSAGILASGYNGVRHYIGPSANYPFAGGGLSSTVGFSLPRSGNEANDSLCMTFYRISPNAWNAAGQSKDGEHCNIASGNILLPGELTTFRYVSPTTISSGSLQLLWEF